MDTRVLYLGLGLMLSNQALSAVSDEQLQRELDALKAQTQAVQERLEQLTEAQDQGHNAASDQQHIEDSFANTTESRFLTPESHRDYADRIENVLNNFIEIDGYFRAGYGRNNAGGALTGFKAPGAMAKYRLGNEAENFGELIFGKTFFLPDAFQLTDALHPASQDSGPVAFLQLRLDFFNPYTDYSTASETSVGVPEAWVAIGNVISSQPQAKFWAGNRFYRRHDIGVNDFFFWNMSGGGAGLEDLQFGPGKLAIAWIGTGATSGFSNLPEPDPENKADFSKTNVDIRYYDVPLLSGLAEIGLVYSRAKSGLDADGNQVSKTSGTAFHLVHTKPAFISDDGVNKFSLQYGTRAAKTFTSGFETFQVDGSNYIQPDLDDSWRFRITENFTANISERWSLGPVLIYQQTQYGEAVGKQTWYSAGVRPIVHFNERFNLAFEAGWDKVTAQAGEAASSIRILTDTHGQLTKLTVAPQISLGNRFNSRPVLRAFVTWARWSNSFSDAVGGNSYAGKTEGLNIGVQMETWW